MTWLETPAPAFAVMFLLAWLYVRVIRRVYSPNT